MVEVINLRNCKDWGKDGDVKIDRTTKWGNPFKLVGESNRKKCIEDYEDYFLKGLILEISELKDAKRLGCWCKPKACHGDVIKKYLDLIYHNETIVQDSQISLGDFQMSRLRSTKFRCTQDLGKDSDGSYRGRCKETAVIRCNTCRKEFCEECWEDHYEMTIVNRSELICNTR